MDDPEEKREPRAASRTIKLKSPRMTRSAAPEKIPAVRNAPFMTRADELKRQMQADMDALSTKK